MPARRCSSFSPRTINSAPGGSCGSRWRRRSRSRGLDITDEQIAELEAHKDDINYDDAPAPGAGVPSRCDEPRLCLRPAVPEGGGHHPSGCDQPAMWGTTPIVILMREGHAARDSRKLLNVMNLLAKFAREVQGYALPGVHAFAACPADHGGQARHAVAQ